MATSPKSGKPSTGRSSPGKPRSAKPHAGAPAAPGQARRRTAGTTVSQTPVLGGRSSRSVTREGNKPVPATGRGGSGNREQQSGYESGFSVEEGSRQRRASKGGPAASSFGGGEGGTRPPRGVAGAKPRQHGDQAPASDNTRRGPPAARGEGAAAAGGAPKRVKRGDGPRHDGGYGPPTQRVVNAAELEVEPARKMRVRRGSDKQVQVSQELRQKRVDTSHIGALRLQKALAVSGVGSRRDCDEWVEQGRVSVDGKIALPGTRVEPGQVVRFDGKIIQIKWPDRLPRIVLYHKQEGELVSRDDPEGRTTVFERLPKVQSSAWVAVGRLDFNTSGLLVFTTSGDLANRMMHPRFEVEREYAVRVLGELTEVQRKELLAGIPLDDGMAKFEVLESQAGEGRNHWYRVVLREGRNREVRRMFEHYELTVSRLMRVRFGILALPSRLKRGEYYELNETEVLGVLKWADLGMTGREKGPRVRIEEHIQAAE